jgi:PBSX family phage terminase large subunit
MPAPDLSGTLSPKQIASIAESTARINIWWGAIRSGKTIASLLRWLMYVATAPRGGELVIVGKTRETIERNVLGPLMDPALFGPLAKLVTHTTGSNQAIILGRVVHLIGANDAKAEGKLRGLTCAGAYVDEATLLPESFWNQLLGRCSVPGAQIFATTNPDSPAHWLRRNFILRADALNLRSWHFELADNPSLTDEFKTAIAAEFVGLWHRRFVLGHWVAAEGAIYDMWAEDRHVVSTLPRLDRWIVSVDYGTTNPFAAGLYGVGADQRLYLARSWRHDSKVARRQMTDAEYSAALRSWLDGIDREFPGAGDPDAIVVDPSAASFIAQLYRDGWHGLTKADNTVIDGIRDVASLLGAGLLQVHESCTGAIEEFPGYAWDPKATEAGEEKPIKAADHDLDQVRYAVRHMRRYWRHWLTSADLTAPSADAA